MVEDIMIYELSEFESEWYDRFMRSMASTDTLLKLVKANKLDQDLVERWIEDRQKKYGE